MVMIPFCQKDRKKLVEDRLLIQSILANFMEKILMEKLKEEEDGYVG